ncbi:MULTISPECIES: hypothetical protein [unclassified Burkholderia]|uniref:hypothetical protein n=1 Tax=unclassified Burkholderia TaxID=2613784 RepID=UPI000F56A808|nr:MULTISPECIES: hypothetical protein [unclassified Burkholderia]RQR78952.1 hypothetical protein DIE10_23265 [Burkholderia sp. Bp9011]RQR89149.1 hypothetical protein DIE09_24715 [Burkholderia sp. Bp9010]RQS57885.1 hypothetical protein DID98_19175 [Burkholderia sp. Bp8984]RQS71825.1 hypothetical protein DID97_21115 [Burkholderia sp. Bp8977]
MTTTLAVDADGSLMLTKWNGTRTVVCPSSAPYVYSGDGWWWGDDETMSYRFNLLPVADDAGNRVISRYLTKRGAGDHGSASVRRRQLLESLGGKP